MIRYFRIYKIFFTSSVMLLAAHRFNLLMSSVANVIWTLGQLLALSFLFDQIDNFDGWTFYELLLLLSFGQIYVYSAFLIYDNNFKSLPQKNHLWRIGSTHGQTSEYQIHGFIRKSISRPDHSNVCNSYTSNSILAFRHPS